MRWCSRLTALLALPTGVIAQSGGDVLAVPGPSSAYVAIAPGESAEFAFEVRNTSDVRPISLLGGFLDVPPAVFDRYRFTPLEPATCSAPTLQEQSGAWVVRFAFVAVAPGGRRTCRYRVMRAADASSALGFNAGLFELGSIYGGQLVRIGPLPDLELALDTLGTGTGDGTLLRLRLVNRSSQAVESRIASTGCHEFGGGFFGPTTFELDGDFPGGCPRDVGALCFSFTGQSFDSRAFRLGPALPGGSSTCLVRVVPRTSAGISQVPMFLFGDRVGLPGGAIGFDPVRDREAVTIGLGLSGAVPVPLGAPALAGIGLLLLVLGLATLRRRDQST